MHQYIIKCKPTKMSNTLYYAGWPGENCILWGPGADKAMPFVTRADAVTVAQKLLDYGHIESYVIELLNTEYPVLPKLGYEETEELKAKALIKACYCHQREASAKIISEIMYYCDTHKPLDEKAFGAFLAELEERMCK